MGHSISPTTDPPFPAAPPLQPRPIPPVLYGRPPPVAVALPEDSPHSQRRPPPIADVPPPDPCSQPPPIVDGDQTIDSVRLQLPVGVLSQARYDRPDNAFTFVLASHRYVCRSSVAEWLSPRVRQLHWIDETIDELTVDVDDPADTFGQFITLGQGESVTVDLERQSTFVLICQELGNAELLQSFDEPITIDNAIEQLQLGQNISQNLAFIASHFPDMMDSIEELSVRLISGILSQRSLVVGNEDSLYDFVRRIGHIELFDLVRFRYVAPPNVADFVDFMLSNSDDVDTILFRCLRSRFQVGMPPRYSSAPPVDCNDVTDGLIATLTRQAGGNVHDCHVVKITSSSAAFGTNARSVASWSDGSYFHSSRVWHSFVCFDFMGMTIRPTRYAIKSGPYGPGASHIKSWIVEGFADGNWITLDQRVDDDSLNDANAAKMFEMMHVCSVGRIRLRQTDFNHFGDFTLMIAGFEVFCNPPNRRNHSRWQTFGQ